MSKAGRFDEVMIVNPFDPARDRAVFLGSDSLARAAAPGDYAEPNAMAYFSEYAGYAGYGGLDGYAEWPGYGEMEPVGYYAEDPLAGYGEYPYALGGYAEYPYALGAYAEYPYALGGYAENPYGIGYAEYPYALGYAEYPYGMADYAEDPGYGEDPLGEYGEDPLGEPYDAYAEELADYADPFGGWGEPEIGEPDLAQADMGMGYGAMPEMVGYGEDPGMAGYVRDVPSRFNAGCPLPTNVNGLGEPGLEGYVPPRQVSPSVTAFTAADTPVSTPETFRPLW